MLVWNQGVIKRDPGGGGGRVQCLWKITKIPIKFSYDLIDPSLLHMTLPYRTLKYSFTEKLFITSDTLRFFKSS